MRAITLRAPWAEAVARLGKRVENRSRPCSYRGPIAIHAGAGLTRRQYEEAAAEIVRLCGRRPAPYAEITRGAVVAVAELADVLPPERGGAGWHRRGCHGLVLSRVRPLPRPVPCAGRQAVPWRLPADVAAAVSAQLV